MALTLQVNNMIYFISNIFYSAMALAGEGDHPHGAGGETEHLYPVLVVFAVLAIGGAAFHFFSKKK